MNLINLAEKRYLPDWIIRFGIRQLLKKRLKQERSRSNDLKIGLGDGEISIHTEAANSQHYEVPAQFYEMVLGSNLKYSCCYFEHESQSLSDAEKAMLELTCERAQITDGLKILDLGCGWGALSLWIARSYPRCTVTALSNSKSQKKFIEDRAHRDGLTNIRVITANMATFQSVETYDRIVSVEMFEHMRDYETLLNRIAMWLNPAGKLFVHIFCHRDLAYPFETRGKQDWMAQHFFTGGVMPSYDLLSTFDRDMHMTNRWTINGKQYAKTCELWLKNLDANYDRIVELFAKDHSLSEAKVMTQRWRIFMMSCAELFGYRDGDEWFVGHYLFEPKSVLKTHIKADNRRNDFNSDEVVRRSR